MSRYAESPLSVTSRIPPPPPPPDPLPLPTLHTPPLPNPTPDMKRSSLSPQDAMASSRRLLLAPPHPYLPTPNPPPSPRNLHIPTRSPSRHIDVADDVDDDLFGSAAWKKKRGKRATKVGQDNGEDMNNYNTRRWALVQLLEQRFRRVTGHVLKIRKWLADVFRGSASDVEGTSDGLHAAGGMNGSAVPTANGAVTATARHTSSDLSSEALVQEVRVCD